MLAPVTRGRAPCWTRTWRLSSASGGLFPLPHQRWGDATVYATRRTPKSPPSGDDKHASAEHHGASELEQGVDTSCRLRTRSEEVPGNSLPSHSQAVSRRSQSPLLRGSLAQVEARPPPPSPRPRSGNRRPSGPP